MLFFLKKTLSFWLLPLPVCLSLIIAGMVLTRKERGRRLGRGLQWTGLLLLILLSNKFISRNLIRPLENQFPSYSLEGEGKDQAPHTIVVLGGGNTWGEAQPALSRLSESALARIVEGLRVAGQRPGTQLVVSGPAIAGAPETHAQALASAARELGYRAGVITQISHARDTEEEALAVAALKPTGPIALVTSAWHMPRALALFRAQGLEVVPCPCDYKGRINTCFNWRDYMWDTESLTRSTLAVREYMGALWNRMRGKGQSLAKCRDSHKEKSGF